MARLVVNGFFSVYITYRPYFVFNALESTQHHEYSTSLADQSQTSHPANFPEPHTIHQFNSILPPLFSGVSMAVLLALFPAFVCAYDNQRSSEQVCQSSPGQMESHVVVLIVQVLLDRTVVMSVCSALAPCRRPAPILQHQAPSGTRLFQAPRLPSSTKEAPSAPRLLLA
jgi:hypothetical protein